ncbi:MAG: plasmid pRiA4b ORF-3 family protein [Peptococcaceae bacterium]|nr:plasmid pRiA4b ORF-3 family protein [Peptococcaceae bacterium]
MKKKDFKHVYQFKITLRYTKPPVWRRIQVPETYTFWDLHVAIQDAMGWWDCHLHEFRLKNPTNGKKVTIGIPYEEEPFLPSKTLPGWDHKIAPYFTMENPKATYLYDFGDGWEHIVKLEKICPREKDKQYPVCIGGKRACPPEDCGGIPGYEMICSGEHEFQEEFEDYDPEYFKPTEVRFDDPEERWKIAFGPE